MDKVWRAGILHSGHLRGSWGDTRDARLLVLFFRSDRGSIGDRHLNGERISRQGTGQVGCPCVDRPLSSNATYPHLDMSSVEYCVLSTRCLSWIRRERSSFQPSSLFSSTLPGGAFGSGFSFDF